MTALHTMALLALALRDSAGQAPYVTRPGGPVDTSGYMWAGYAVTAIVYGGYIALLLRRLSRARKGRDAVS
jgi:hypothetical protein